MRRSLTGGSRVLEVVPAAAGVRTLANTRMMVSVMSLQIAAQEQTPVIVLAAAAAGAAAAGAAAAGAAAVVPPSTSGSLIAQRGVADSRCCTAAAGGPCATMVGILQMPGWRAVKQGSRTRAPVTLAVSPLDLDKSGWMRWTAKGARPHSQHAISLGGESGTAATTRTLPCVASAPTERQQMVAPLEQIWTVTALLLLL